jgi:hypothetical protein
MANPAAGMAFSASPRGGRGPPRVERRNSGRPGPAFRPDTGPEASIEAALSVRGYFGLSHDRAGTILGEVEAAVAMWRSEGRSLGMTRRKIDQFADAFEHAERAEARKASR